MNFCGVLAIIFFFVAIFGSNDTDWVICALFWIANELETLADRRKGT